MFGSRSLSAVLLVCSIAVTAAPAGAQSQHRQRRESNVNRQARIDRIIADTYTHRWEVAGGGGYLRFRSGEFLQKNDEVTFFLSAHYALNPKLGIVGNVGGAYGNAKIGNNIFGLNPPQISEYTFLVGPAYRFLAKEKYSVGGFATGGVGVGKFDSGSKGLTSRDIGVYTSAYKPAFSAGMNLDYNFFPNLAFRVQPVYLGTLFTGEQTSGGTVGTIQNNFGVNFGAVYRFGRLPK